MIQSGKTSTYLFSYCRPFSYKCWLINSENRLYASSVFLPLSQAFDTANHEMLLQKLLLYFGIKGSTLQLFSEYLLNRKQYVISRYSKPCFENMFLSGQTVICFRATSIYYEHNILAEFFNIQPLYLRLRMRTFVCLINICMTCIFRLTVNFLKQTKGCV